MTLPVVPEKSAISLSTLVVVVDDTSPVPPPPPPPPATKSHVLGAGQIKRLEPGAALVRKCASPIEQLDGSEVPTVHGAICDAVPSLKTSVGSAAKMFLSVEASRVLLGRGCVAVVVTYSTVVAADAAKA